MSEIPPQSALPSDDPQPPQPLQYATARTPSPQGAHKLVVIATFANPWEANLAKGKLEAAGIPAALDGENVAAGIGTWYGNAVGSVKLRVSAIDAERALAALPRRVRARIVKCPKCGGIETRQVDFSPGLKMMFLLMLGLPYLFVQKPWACTACGNVWNASKDDEEYDDAEDEDEEDEDDDSETEEEDTDDAKPV